VTVPSSTKSGEAAVALKYTRPVAVSARRMEEMHQFEICSTRPTRLRPGGRLSSIHAEASATNPRRIQGARFGGGRSER
jgi:hypothetical protein